MSGRALLAPVSVFLASFLLLIFLLQDVTYGDGIFYLSWAREGRLYSHHHLWLPELVSFAKLCEALGLSDRKAGFLFSAFSGSLGCLFLWLRLQPRTGPPGLAPALVFLVLSTPVFLFFATTAENHAQHFAWTCLCLWLLGRASGRNRRRDWILAGLALACIPASHLTGFLLLPFLLLMGATREGREPFLREWRRGRLLRLPLLLLPLLVYVGLFHLHPWFKREVLELRPDLLASPIEVEFRNKILGREQSPLDWLRYLWETWFLTGFGIWIPFVPSLFLLAKKRFRRGVLVLSAALPYLVIFPLHGTPERGAYFLALLPVAALSIAWLAAEAGPRMWPLPLLLLGLAQGGWGWKELRAYPGEDPDPPWAWAREAMEAASPGPSEVATFLCKDLWRSFHLTYDHPGKAEGVHFPGVIQSFRQDLPAYLEVFKTENLPDLLRAGPVFLTEECREELPRLWPEVLEYLEEGFSLEPVRKGSFKASRIGRR